MLCEPSSYSIQYFCLHFLLIFFVELVRLLVYEKQHLFQKFQQGILLNLEQFLKLRVGLLLAHLFQEVRKLKRKVFNEPSASFKVLIIPRRPFWMESQFSDWILFANLANNFRESSAMFWPTVQRGSEWTQQKFLERWVPLIVRLIVLIKREISTNNRSQSTVKLNIA